MKNDSTRGLQPQGTGRVVKLEGGLACAGPDGANKRCYRVTAEIAYTGGDERIEAGDDVEIRTTARMVRQTWPWPDE